MTISSDTDGEILTVPVTGCDMHFITVPASSTLSAPVSAGELFGRAAAGLLRGSVAPIQEKIYGRVSAKNDILETRRRVYRERGIDPDLPCMFIEGEPLGQRPLSGVQIWGLGASGCSDPVRTVSFPDGVVGRAFSVDGLDLLYLSALDGVPRGYGDAGTATAQAREMFVRAKRALSKEGMGFTHVARTWIYLRRILDRYGVFNEVRTDFFSKTGLRDYQGTPFFPASTGIQGCTGAEECLMDLLAVSEGGRPSERLAPIRATSRQNEANAYGSAFSRGATLELRDRTLVFVSGTASINASGTTIHLDDPEEQCIETLENVGALLADQGGSLADVVMATLFCKSPEVEPAYRRAKEKMNAPSFPTLTMLADVCRDDLLVEIEALAVIENR